MLRGEVRARLLVLVDGQLRGGHLLLQLRNLPRARLAHGAMHAAASVRRWLRGQEYLGLEQAYSADQPLRCFYASLATTRCLNG